MVGTVYPASQAKMGKMGRTDVLGGASPIESFTSYENPLSTA
jgi:hypothetical protein